MIAGACRHKLGARTRPAVATGLGLGLGLVLALLAVAGVPRIIRAQASSPVIVVDTERGTFAFETFAKEAPVSVAHIVKLAQAGFYDGQRVHRAVAGFVVQFGDPQSRDLNLRADWGRGERASSGSPVGLAEMSARRKNVMFAVGLAHMGDPAKADSQLYILLEAHPELDGQYAVIGKVVEGEAVTLSLQVGDVIRRVYLRE